MRYPISTFKRPTRAGDVHITIDYEALSRMREVFLIVMVAVSILCYIELFEYQPGINHGVAYAMILAFGGMRYIAASMFAYFGITLYSHWNKLSEGKHTLILKFIGLTLLFLSIDYIFGKNEDGGLLGNWLIGFISSDPAIALVLVLSAFLSGVFLMTRLSWYDLSLFLYHFVQTFLFFKAKIVNRRNRIIDSNYNDKDQLSDSCQLAPYLAQGNGGLNRSTPEVQSQLLLNDQTAYQLSSALQQFGIKSIVSGKEAGLAFTRYEVHLAPGVKSSAIVSLRKDIARSLLVHDVKIIEVIAGKSCVGIEIPNANREVCNFFDLQYSLDTCNERSLSILLGKTSTNEIRIVDLEKMPHLLVAGRTGSGKTMLLHSILMSLTNKASPQDLKIILIDGKGIAFSAWKNLPHLYTDIISDAGDAIAILNWCVAEMQKRYKYIAENPLETKFPKVVVIIDEFADLITNHKSEIEESVTRLAQKARQINIHLILATQRPTVDVITGQIRANIPARIALSVSDRRESRIVLDDIGAENLLGQGDMLFKSSDRQCERIHAPFVSDDYIIEHVSFLKSRYENHEPKIVCEDNNDEDKYYVSNSDNAGDSESQSVEKKMPINLDDYRNQDDPKYPEAVLFVRETGKASISAIQAKCKIGYQRALNIVSSMEERGVLGKRERYNRPMKVLSENLTREI